jgi:endonuclease/exonuclease/phosphatase family metal-dependent hydrolase
MDNRVRPQRIVRVLEEIDADIIGLQEVLCISSEQPILHQAGYIAGSLGLQYCFGATRRLNGGIFGNVILSRFPIMTDRNYDISVGRRESRCCLRADIEIGDRLAHVFNVHLGTGYLERRRQARRLIDAEILYNENLEGVRLMLGDFNEWTRGLTTRALSSRLRAVNGWKRISPRRTYPGILPIFGLDNIYFDPAVKLSSCCVWRTMTSLIASDHLPFIADFRWEFSSQ